MPATCTVEGCDRPYLAKGFCEMHYHRMRNRGTTDPLPRWTSCSVDGCFTEGPYVRGYCKRHYAKWKRYNDPLGGREIQPAKVCSHDGCERWAFAHGYCSAHHVRFIKGQDMDRPIEKPRLTKWLGVTCTECDRHVYARALCRRHYASMHRRERQAKEMVAA